ncbi:stage III sporulation protein AF [Alicyclobacillus shizuokensis]|uniref:stage III sporulation protein AF n=1 Tax=Alicyclobacillus shizuokensis TaxID=392014 RepID=UPI00082E665D|nr:stage III sporulation protein AF [Alicyclobacillus shizuokensis]MCL6625740.1 stage III sporulation protein AF [Alicyclobacillus shizuokensis]
MNALGAWLKQIVLVVMLAILADMLLPTRAMQKYVRMVMGLAIIAVILGPLTPMARRDWAAHLADWALRQVSSAAASETVSSSNEVDTNRLQQTLAKQQDQVANQNLAQELKQGLADDLGVQADKVVVSGASTANEPRALVTVSSEYSGRASEIRQFVARTLGVSEAHVQVVTGGRGR